ncbi:hypothetical protein Pcinc_037056 [Petrolisthes cinctipes]|uniref:Sodium/potassium-transporting ATPase subunit beta n=1 Tax=Petrolisthes cinctipes TaxID=88211 RepID=A0AAE1BTJ6_PETCI|nr:hypothetical protein Pcinc_037056 [Petrolisthes cinctipes]
MDSLIFTPYHNHINFTTVHHTRLLYPTHLHYTPHIFTFHYTYSSLRIIGYQRPYYTGKDTLLKHAGVTVCPRADSYQNKVYTYSYDPNVLTTSEKYVREIDEFLKPYENQDPSKYRNCYDDTDDESDERPCRFDPFTVLNKTTCSRDNRWGYSTTSPCFIVRVNKVVGFIPGPFPNSHEFIKNETKVSKQQLDQILVTGCYYGKEHGDDVLEISRPVIKNAGIINRRFFPYTNQPGYLSPFMMSRIVSAELYAVEMSCLVMATNIPWFEEDYPVGIYPMKINFLWI